MSSFNDLSHLPKMLEKEANDKRKLLCAICGKKIQNGQLYLLYELLPPEFAFGHSKCEWSIIHKGGVRPGQKNQSAT